MSPADPPETDPLLAFFIGHPDPAGRTIDQILAWPDDQLERRHDFIQWLFPNPTPSPVNPDAPVIQSHHRAAFAARPELRANLRRALLRMLDFYGLQCADADTDQPTITRDPDTWPRKHPRWLTRNDHNHLRLTRILIACTLLGPPRHASALLACLEDIARAEGRDQVSDATLHFWRDAAKQT